MSRRWLFILGAPLLTAAALLLSTSSALAGGHGGGHAGHAGGGHGGAWGGGWHGGGWGGGYYHRGWGGYPGFWWGNYGYYPYSNYYYSDYWPGYYTSDYNYQPDYYYTSPESGYQSFYPSDLGNNQNVARINVQVPANAEIFVDGVKTSQTGPFREFVSPALKPGSNYTYEIRAKWTQNGQTMDRTKTVPIHAGDVANVNFMQAAASNAQQPAPANATEQAPPNNNPPANPTQPNKAPSATNPPATNPPLPTAPPRK